MNIMWITGRNLKKDLASSTEIGLFNALVKMGHKVTIFSPSKINNSKIRDFINFNYYDINGLRTISGQYFLKNKIRNSDIITNVTDIAIVDWRYVAATSKLLEEKNIPWLIIDRGPPAYSGFFSKIQKIMWKRAWKKSSEHSSGGLVVSEGHKIKVSRYSSPIKVEVINAGIELELFNQKSKEIKDIIKIIYCGRIDRNRGVLKIIELIEKKNLISIPSEIHIIGEGDCSKIFKNRSLVEKDLIFHGKLNRNEVYKIMDSCHIGIMPMPNKEIWRIASPLKLTEYAASGLIIIGNEHEGNRFEGKIHDWSKLQIGEDWVNLSIDEINKIIKCGNSKNLSKNAKISSKNYSWESQAEKIIRFVENYL